MCILFPDVRNYVKEVIMGMIEVHAEVSTSFHPFVSAVKLGDDCIQNLHLGRYIDGYIQSEI